MKPGMFALQAGLWTAFFLGSANLAPGKALLQETPNQMIHGRLVDFGLKTPIEGATVRLTTVAGRELDRVSTTNKNGVFIMAVEPGAYKLLIRRIGYSPVETEIIRLNRDENFEATWSLTPVAVRLAKINVVATPKRERGRNGFYERKALGKGVFLTPADFAEIKHEHPSIILGVAEGIRTTPDLGIESEMGWKCLQFLVNRLPVKMVAEMRMSLDEQFPTLFELVPNGLEIAGIEVYREFSEVPQEFRFDAWPQSNDARGVTPMKNLSRLREARPPDPCGIVNIWTKAAW